jgi:hypothetical protein
MKLRAKRSQTSNSNALRKKAGIVNFALLTFNFLWRTKATLQKRDIIASEIQLLIPGL